METGMYDIQELIKNVLGYLLFDQLLDDFSHNSFDIFYAFNRTEWSVFF